MNAYNLVTRLQKRTNELKAKAEQNKKTPYFSGYNLQAERMELAAGLAHSEMLALETE